MDLSVRVAGRSTEEGRIPWTPHPTAEQGRAFRTFLRDLRPEGHS